ncbi:hypothetical protein YC2023_009774 [Brassica napus]
MCVLTAINSYLSIKSESNDLCYPSKLTMANSCILLGDLKAGRCTNTVMVHLLRFWEAEKCQERRRVGGGMLLLTRSDQQCYLSIKSESNDLCYPSKLTMANSCILLGDLKAGRCTNTVVVHLLRFWEAEKCEERRRVGGGMLLLTRSLQLLVSASKAGRCTETVVVRLVWFREARNVNKNGDLMGVDMVLVDERVYFTN